jgi:hypothetical protein
MKFLETKRQTGRRTYRDFPWGRSFRAENIPSLTMQVIKFDKKIDYRHIRLASSIDCLGNRIN